MRFPYEEPSDQGHVHRRPQCHDRFPPYVLHYRPEEQAADGVHHPEADHHVPHGGDSQSAGHVRLGEVRPDERLFHAYPHGDRDEQLLVGFLQLVSGGREELDAG